MRLARVWLVLAAFGCSGAPQDDLRPGNFAIVVLPDTQHYSDRFPRIFDAQTRWIVEHAAREQIAFVTHVGDVVQSGATDPKEWDVAERALGRLDGVIPWGVAIGNHDYDRVNDRDGQATEFVRRFGPSRFRGKPAYGGHSPNGLNSFHTFQAHDRPYLVLHLEADVPDEAIRWAESVLRDNPVPPVIVTTHIYLDDKTRKRTRAAYFRKAGNSGEQL